MEKKETVTEELVPTDNQEPLAPEPDAPANDQDDEFIVPPSEDPKEDATVEVTEAPTEELKEEETVEPIVIGDKSFTEQELETVLALGAQAFEYQKERPGFDFVKLHADYTKKSMDLAKANARIAELEKNSSKTIPADLSDVDPGDVALIEKVARGLGFVKKDEIAPATQTREVVLQTFRKANSVYSDDSKWEALQSELALFKETDDLTEFQTFLERAHERIAKTSSSPTSLAKIIANKRRNQIAMQKTSGGSQTPEQIPSNEKQPLNERQKAMLASLRGFSEEERERILAKLK